LDGHKKKKGSSPKSVGEISESSVSKDGFFEALQGIKMIGEAFKEALVAWGPKASGITFLP
jgi:hypothetical protein